MNCQLFPEGDVKRVLLRGTASGPRLSGIDFNPTDGTLFAGSARNGTNPDSLFTIELATGAATLVGVPGGTGGCHDLAFDNGGTLYGTDTRSLFSIDLTTGVGTEIGDLKNSVAMEGLAVDPTTNTLYGLEFDSAVYFSIDKGTGEATFLGLWGAAASGSWWSGLGINDSGQVFGSTGQGSGDIARLDPDFSFVEFGQHGASVSDIAFLPEPGTLVPALSSIGLGLLYAALAGCSIAALRAGRVGSRRLLGDARNA